MVGIKCCRWKLKRAENAHLGGFVVLINTGKFAF